MMKGVCVGLLYKLLGNIEVYLIANLVLDDDTSIRLWHQ